MRIFLPTLCLALLHIGGTATAQAEEPTAERASITPELIQAHYNLKAAQARVLDYQHIALPTTRRVLDQQIRLAETEVRILRGRLRDYRQALRIGEFSPVRTAFESHLLSLIATEQQLRQLKEDRINLMRTSRQQYTLQNLEILHAAARLAEVRTSGGK